MADRHELYELFQAAKEELARKQDEYYRNGSSNNHDALTVAKKALAKARKAAMNVWMSGDPPLL